VYAQLVSVSGERDRGIDVVRWVRARYPTYARAWGLEITLVARAGRVAETERLIDTMLVQPLVPASAVVFSLRRTAASLAFSGDTAAAHRTLARALAVLDRDDRTRRPRTGLDRAQLLYDLGELAEAKTLLTALVAADSNDVEARGYLGLIAARRADTAAAVTVDKWLETARPAHVFTRTLYRARIAASLGDHERSLQLLGSALDESGRFLVPGYREYPEFACLREDDRFDQLMTLR
jgi:tetratricopeptide (TPR) repeat protein